MFEFDLKNIEFELQSKLNSKSENLNLKHKTYNNFHLLLMKIFQFSSNKSKRSIFCQFFASFWNLLNTNHPNPHAPQIETHPLKQPNRQRYERQINPSNMEKIGCGLLKRHGEHNHGNIRPKHLRGRTHAIFHE